MFLEKLMCFHFRYLLTRLESLYQWSLPYGCILCASPTHSFYNICEDCLKDLPILPQCCLRCANFLHLNRIKHEKHDFHEAQSLSPICGACLTSPPPFERTYALFPYEFPIIQLILQLKFCGNLAVAKAFGELFIQRIRGSWYTHQRLPDVIIPIPLHAKRLRERGFNQALEIARPISKALNIPLGFTGSIRIKETEAQSRLLKANRAKNMKDAFKIKKIESGLRVAVIDDVITTGQTVTEFCQELKAKGIKSIHLWCCARRS